MSRIDPAPDREILLHHSPDELIEVLQMAPTNWLAHDGLWFLVAADSFDVETAIELDQEACEPFTSVQAKRTAGSFGIQPRGGIPTLKQAIRYRLFAHTNEQEIIDKDGRILILGMTNCRDRCTARRPVQPQRRTPARFPTPKLKRSSNDTETQGVVILCK